MYNKVFLIGNLTRDPEVRYTTAGIAVARFGIAVNRISGKNSVPASAGTANQDVDFINIIAWRRLAEICKEYLKKGRPVAIEGRLQINRYEKDGEKKVFAEVVADNMQMLGKRPDAAGGQEREVTSEEPQKPSINESERTGEEEVPF